MAVKILNFYNSYMNNIITLYYVIGSERILSKNNEKINEALNRMELGFGITVVWHGNRDRDIEMGGFAPLRTPYSVDELVNLPRREIPAPMRLSLIHPDDC